MADKGANYLSEKLDTRVEIGHVKIDFLNRVHLEQLYIEDQQKDTLAFIGDFSVSTTSLFNDYWNDKLPVVKNIKLKGGVVRLLRKKDSPTWNYSFIEDAFATDGPKDTSASEMPDVQLNNLDVEDVHFSMIDQWVGHDFIADVGTLALEMDLLDLPNKKVSIDEIIVENSNIAFLEYTGGKPKTPNKKVDESDWGTPFNPDNYLINLSLIDLSKVDFEYRRKNHVSKPGLFDEQHIVATNLNTRIEKIAIDHDELTAQIKSLTVQERSGLVINAYRADVKLTQQMTELDNLYLKTNHSVVRDYYRMSYNNFHAFNDYIGSVNMYARLKNSTVDKRDIAFFSGDIPQLPIVMNINGKAEGTVDNLFAEGITVEGGQTYFNGDARIVGLPDIELTQFNLQAKQLRTTGSEVLRFVPEANVDGVHWNALKNINFQGSFVGGTKKFTTEGFLATNQGNAKVNLNMDLSQQVPSYSGKVRTEKLRLDNILDQKEIGEVTMSGFIEGRGFDLENLNARVDAQVQNMTLQGERYENVVVAGKVSNKQFEGTAISKDKNLGFDFAGKLDLRTDNPSFDFKSDILRLNLKNFGVTPDDMFITAKADLDFVGKNIDNFTGKAHLNDITIRTKDSVVTIPFLNLNSYIDDERDKVLKLESTLADANIKGDYSITGIQAAVQSFLHYYIPAYIKKVKVPEDENFTFDLLVKDGNDLIHLFDPKLNIANGSNVQGLINTRNQQMTLLGSMPFINYGEYELKDIILDTKGDYTNLELNLNTQKLMYNEDAVITDASMNIGMANDTAHLLVKTNPSNDILGKAILECKASAYNGILQIDMLPSSFILKDDKWNVFSDYPIILNDVLHVDARDFYVQNGTQRFLLNAFSQEGKNNALLEIENLDMERVSSYLNTAPFVYKARINSTVNISDVFGDLLVKGTVNTTNEFRINSDTIGVVNTNFEYNKESNQLVIGKGSKISRGLNDANFDGSIGFEDKKLNLHGELDKTSIAILNQFLTGTVDSIQGSATGEIAVTGTFDAPNILGAVEIDNAQLRVVFTGCKYSMDKIKLALNNEAIRFDPITIYDERDKPGQATVTGIVSHKAFDKYRLNINIKSDDFLTLNTDEYSGELFYGYIPASVQMKVTGAINDVTLDINAEPMEKSRFYLPIKSSGDAGSYDYITFKQVGRLQDQKKELGQETYFKVNMNIAATPNVEAYIILDPNNGEQIIAKGNGNIKLEVDLGNNISMYNSFVIKEGKYLFNFRGLLKKEFDLEDGGSITWNGDPYDALLNVNAIYKTRVSLYPLIASDVTNTLVDIDNADVSSAKALNDTEVKIELEGPLSEPQIDFDIEQPNNNDIGSLAMAKLQRIREDKNELIYQSGMILLFNSFKPIQGGVNAGSLISSTGASTASDVIGTALSPILNNAINKLTGAQNISLNLGYKNYSSDISSQGSNRNQLNLGVNGSFFNNRVQVTFGNSFDFASNAAAVEGSNLTYGGDFRAQYLLTEDGRYRVNAFRVSNYDFVENRPIAKGGVGLTYKKVFNTWKDLFRRKNKPKEGAKDIKKGVDVTTTP